MQFARHRLDKPAGAQANVSTCSSFVCDLASRSLATCDARQVFAPTARRALAVLVLLTGLVIAGPPSLQETALPLAAAATQVHESMLTVVDKTRATVSHGQTVSPMRTLPTLLIAPTAGGPHPLVVFCHGYDIAVTPYLHLLRHWALAGFIVAAPSFPLTAASAGAHLDEDDIVNQPRDATVVLTAVERALGLSVDHRRVFVAGHSDGGATSFGAGFATSLRDPRWTGVLVFSGDRRRSMGGFSAPPRTLPLLLVQSDHDEFNSLAEAWKVWTVARSPRDYLHLHGAPHLAPFASPGAYRDIVEVATTDWLQAWAATGIKTRQEAQQRLRRDGTRPGFASLTVM
ncbi:MAG: hypothetical protein JWO12_2853 [Frankiales bacterium]|nr:hypothetical protein [Frankiales bacterium]